MKRRMVVSSLIVVAVLSPFVSCVVYEEQAAAAKRTERAAKTAFKNKTVCPSTGMKGLNCPGYWIDFIVPKKCGGPIAATNMQYLTIEDHKMKTRYEIRGDENHKPCMGYKK